jgi:hypothetical protein
MVIISSNVYPDPLDGGYGQEYGQRIMKLLSHLISLEGLGMIDDRIVSCRIPTYDRTDGAFKCSQVSSCPTRSNLISRSS